MPSKHRSAGLIVTIAAALALSACDDPAQQAADHFQQGTAFEEQGNLEKARVEFRNALELNPENPEASWRLGQIEEELGDVRMAYRYYLRAADPALGHIDSQVRIIELLMAAGRLEKAEARATMAIGLEPKNPDLLALRAAILQMQGQKESAVQDAKAALRHDGGHGGAVSVLATVYMNEGRTGRAIALLDEAIAPQDPDPALVRLLGLAHAASGDRDAAIEQFRRLVDIKPEDTGNRAMLARTLASAGDVEAGEAVLREGLGRDGAAGGATAVAYVQFLAEHRGADAAAAELKRQIEKNPDTATFDIALANLRAQTEDREAALETLAAAEDRLGDGAAALRVKAAMARQRLAMGDLDRAATITEDVLAQDPEHVRALLVRASLNDARGRPQDAVHDLNTVLSVEPQNVAALRQLAEQHQKAGRPAEAAAVLQQLADARPRDQRVRLQLASMLHTAGETGKARDLMDDLVRRDPTSVPGWLTLGHAALDRGDWTEARRAISKLEETPGGAQPALRLEAELAATRGDHEKAAETFRQLAEQAESKAVRDTALTAYTENSIHAGHLDAARVQLGAIAETASGADAALAHRLLARVAGAAENPEEARGELRAAIEADADDAAAYNRLARLHAVNNQPQEALEVLDEGLATKADPAPLLITKAMIQEMTGQPEEAMDTYREALEHTPSSRVAANNYAALVADRRADDPQALKDALSRVEPFAAENEPTLVDTIAWLNHRLGNEQAARTLLERIDAATHQNPQIRYHYGAVLMALGDEKKGVSVLQSIEGQDFPGSEEAERLLAAN